MSTTSHIYRAALVALALGAVNLPATSIAATAQPQDPGSSKSAAVNQPLKLAGSPTQVARVPDYVVPTIPVGSTSPAGTTIPSTRPSSPSNSLPSVIVSPTPSTRPVFTPPTTGAATGLNYRVIVAPQTLAQQAQVKALVPGAFQTTVNGQSVMQVGLFREQSKADNLAQTLNRNNLQATILTIPASAVAPTVPSGPSSSPIPNGRVVVVLDPGHGGADPGAVGIAGLQEKETVLAISRQVATLLQQQGIQVVMTRSTDQEIDLEPRVKFAKQANANLFVSIHANSISMSRPDISGLETYYYSGSAEGRQLAQTIHNTVVQQVGMRDRGVRTANFYVVKYTAMPAALVEVGFVTGNEDASRLANAAGRTRLAQAIARGIEQYVRANLVSVR